MKSFTKPLLFGVLAIGVSAGYGNDTPVANTPCTTATPVTPVPQYQSTSEAPPPVYTVPTTEVTPPSSSAPPASSAPPEVTCPYIYITSCAYLCNGSNAVAYCSGSDVTDNSSGITCTACPGAPAPSTEPVYTPPPQAEPSPAPSTTEPAYTPPPVETELSSVPPATEPAYTPPAPPTTLSTVPAPSPTPEAACPYTYTASCAYLCKGGAEQVAYCSDKDVSSDYGEISCSACPGAPVTPPNNGTTNTPPAPTNVTTPYPTPTYNSGATALNIGTAVIFGLICMMFTL
ncbi:uncharacterized protein DFL_005446 [Arthrobotrys flagrans]|uniref:WSC domain-containing protein n=1 Tax=Arthrobotrys flagrans TaxID=97331 RepID=A0A436ZXF1_ARTFL|nr:hypothetical protein DFL_005446 [Arthrobotrys flagrans]